MGLNSFPAFQNKDANKKTLQERLESDEQLSLFIEDYPESLDFIEENLEFLDDPEARLILFENLTLRREATEDIKQSLTKRLLTHPEASPEELSAGVYWECLEPQVRNAMQEIRRKGYATFESGFRGEVTRTQYIGMEKGSIDPNLANQLQLTLQDFEVDVEFEVAFDDRELLNLHARHKLGLEDWEEVWSVVSEALPDKGFIAPDTKIPGADMFREKQDQIKNGKSVYVGEGILPYWIEDGKLIEKD